MSEIHTIKNVLRRQVGDKVYFIGNLSSDVAKKTTYVPVAEDKKTYLARHVYRYLKDLECLGSSKIFQW